MQLLYVANRFEYKPRLDLWIGAGDMVMCDRTARRASRTARRRARRGWLDEIQRPICPLPT